MSVYEVPAWELINEIAQDLKTNRKVEQPAFVPFVKSGAHRERAPQNPDWWYIRCASLLRRIYIDGPVGVQRLRTCYGGKRNLGARPSHFRRASGKVIRTCLQALEDQGFVFKVDKAGRKTSPAGEKYLNLKAKSVLKKLPQLAAEAEQRKAERSKRLMEREKEKRKLKEMTQEFRTKEKKSKKEKKEKEKREAPKEKKVKGKQKQKPSKKKKKK